MSMRLRCHGSEATVRFGDAAGGNESPRGKAYSYEMKGCQLSYMSLSRGSTRGMPPSGCAFSLLSGVPAPSGDDGLGAFLRRQRNCCTCTTGTAVFVPDRPFPLTDGGSCANDLRELRNATTEHRAHDINQYQPHPAAAKSRQSAAPPAAPLSGTIATSGDFLFAPSPPQRILLAPPLTPIPPVLPHSIPRWPLNRFATLAVHPPLVSRVPCDRRSTVPGAAPLARTFLCSNCTFLAPSIGIPPRRLANKCCRSDIPHVRSRLLHHLPTS